MLSPKVITLGYDGCGGYLYVKMYKISGLPGIGARSVWDFNNSTFISSKACLHALLLSNLLPFFNSWVRGKMFEDKSKINLRI